MQQKGHGNRNEFYKLQQLLVRLPSRPGLSGVCTISGEWAGPSTAAYRPSVRPVKRRSGRPRIFLCPEQCAACLLGLCAFRQHVQFELRWSLDVLTSGTVNVSGFHSGGQSWASMSVSMSYVVPWVHVCLVSLQQLTAPATGPT